MKWRGGFTQHGYVSARGMHHKYEHRVLWEKHHGPIPANHVIHHKDGNGQNNSLDNLELMSKAQHQQHHASEISAGKLRSDKTWKPKGEIHPAHKFTVEQVLSIRARIAAGESVMALAKEFNVGLSAISKIKHRRRWQHI